MKRLAALWVLLHLAKATATAQEVPNPLRQSIIEQRIEQIAESIENEAFDYNTLFEQLSVYIDFPLNLNKATVDELFSMGLLTNYQITQLILYRKNYGDLLSLYELAHIPGWNYETADLILPFVVVLADQERERITFTKLRNYGKHEVVARWMRVLETQLGYTPATPERLLENPNARYLGSPDALFLRYRYRFGDRISFGFTGDKDPGEEFLRGSRRDGFDFYSAHLFLKDFGRFKHIAIGDYQAQFGQGLTFWSGFGFNRKTAFTMSTAQLGGGLRAYTSINEVLFLRGAAATLQEGAFSFTGFYSGKHITGTVNTTSAADSIDTFEPEVVVSAFQEGGFHRTPRELTNRKAVFQEHFGGHLTFKNENLQLGFTAVHMRLDAVVRPRFSEYNQFRFAGSDNTTMGLDYAWRFRNFYFFGETARSANGGVATLNGANIIMHPRLSFNVTQRYYSRDFQPIASVAFGEGSSTENESGVYLGLEFKPFKRWKVNAYYDQFKFPWLRFQADAPSTGNDFFVQAEYQPNSRTNFYMRYRHRTRQINVREVTEGVRFLVDNPRENMRFNFLYRPARSIKLQSRVELSSFERGQEGLLRGYLVFQDVSYAFRKVPLTLTARYALFQTDGFDARIYAYENDVLYFFSIPAYSGRGARAFILAKYDLGKRVDLWVRWAQFFYTDRQVVGSGLDESEGPTRTQVRVQARFKF
jgi:hypothetical protein